MILSDGVTSLTLPDSLDWTDEYWVPVVQSVDYSLTGAPVVQSSLKSAGRPITLQSTMNGALVYGDVSRATLDALQAMASNPDAVLTLTLADETEYTCIFRHTDNAISASPVFGRSDRRAAEWWLITLRLMQQ